MSLQPAPVPTVVPNFNRIAGLYRWLEYLSFGPLLQRCRCTFLPQIADTQRALVLGDGDGRFTGRLLLLNRTVRVSAIDASPAMLMHLEHRSATFSGRLTTECTDARTWRPIRSDYDAIVTHFFLDCLTTVEVGELAKRVSACVTPGAIWLVSEFAVPSGLFGRVLAAPLVAALYRVFRWITGLQPQSLPDHCTSLEKSGWTIEARRTYLRGLLVSEIWRRAPLATSS